MFFYYIRRFFEFLFTPIRALFTSPDRLRSAGRRPFRISVPARVAFAVAFVLVVCVIIWLVVVANDPNAARLGTLTKLGYIVGILFLVVVIPILVYKVLRLLTAPDVSPFRDIDLAWAKGTAALEQNGLDLAEIPIFLVLGSADEVHEKCLFEGSGLRLNLGEIPTGPGAIHWYANPEGIYICGTDTGCLSKLAEKAKAGWEKEQSAPGPLPLRPPGGTVTGTLVMDRDSLPDRPTAAPEPTPEAAPADGPGGPGNIYATMQAPSLGAFGKEGYGADASTPGQGAVGLPQDEATTQEQRLAYVCQLIRNARQPLSPINGILVLLPYDLIRWGTDQAVRDLELAMQRDLRTVLRAGKVRCPVTTLVTGMEKESGLQELVRRVGYERAAHQRFGKGFSLSNPPLPERLEALAAHACGAFEEWVYALFREKDSLSKPGNTKLYSLLCGVRHPVRVRLADILAGGIGVDLERDPQAEPFLFSGCYFAATGEGEDRQVFVRGVFDKLPREQAELQWTRTALAEDQNRRKLLQVVVGIDVLLLLVLAYLLVDHFWLS
jgi:hypothetical protein